MKRIDEARALYEESISIFENRRSANPAFHQGLLNYSALLKRIDRPKSRQLERRANALIGGK